MAADGMRSMLTNMDDSTTETQLKIINSSHLYLRTFSAFFGFKSAKTRFAHHSEIQFVVMCLGDLESMTISP